MIVQIKIAKEKGAGWWKKKKNKTVALNYLKYNSLQDKFWAATQQDCYSSPIIYLTLRGTERRTGWISVIWMRVSWIWWYRPVRDFIRLQIQWPDRQWGYDHRNRYSQSPVIRSSISSLDLSTLLHWIWWKCNRSVLAGWWARIPASQKRWSRSGFDAPHVNKSGFMFIYLFIFNLLWTWCCSRRRRLPRPCHWNIKAWLLPLIPVSMQPYEPRVAKRMFIYKPSFLYNSSILYFWTITGKTKQAFAKHMQNPNRKAI